MGLAYGTATATPNGTKPIQNCGIGDQVLAGSPNGSGGFNWTPVEVQFSSGVPDGRTPMIFIRFGENRIICTPNQPFLMPDGKVKRAERLIPGVDRLVNAEGKPVEISDIVRGDYTRGVHGIATDIRLIGSLDHHLLITEGVVTGDYCAEISFDELAKNGLAVKDDEESAI